MTQAYMTRDPAYCAMFLHNQFVVSREMVEALVRRPWDVLTHGPELTGQEMDAFLDNAILPDLNHTSAIRAREALFDAGIEIEFWKLHNRRLA